MCANGPARRQAHDFAISSGIPLPSILHDGVNVIIESCYQTLAYRADFGDNRITFHYQSPISSISSGEQITGGS
jgi:hypothetical protein